MSVTRVEWDVDVDTDIDTGARISGWQPYATDQDGNVLFSLDMWFQSEEDGRAWLTENIIGRAHVAGWPVPEEEQ